MERIKRVLALTLCGAMLVGNLPIPVFAEDLFQQGLCEHHLVHNNCGYQEAIIGSDCVHEHTEECYTQAHSCVHQHGDCSYVESSDEITCDHQCTAENGCISNQLACCHSHDDQCGYAEPQESSPCTYVCEECIQQDSPVCTGALDCPVNEHDDGCEKKAADEKAAEDQAAADAVAVLIDALPALEVIQAKEQLDQQEDYNQVQTAYETYESLTEEQKTLLSAYDDFFRPYFEYFNSLTTTVWDGAGSSSSPYLIYTEESLRAISESVRDGNSYSGLYFKLANDIELTEAWIPIGTADTYFCGIFDGNNYSISGLSATGDHIGLFAYVGAGSVIQNVTLDNLYLSGGPYLGGIAAYADASNGQISIVNCKVYGTVNATRKAGFDVPNYGGGLIGYGKGTVTNPVIIKDCTNYAYIDVNSYTYYGGVGGLLNNVKVEGCINYGVVDGSLSADDGACFVGGIGGISGSTSFVGCANYGSVTAFACAGICDGGSTSKFSNCLNAGKIQHHSDGTGYALGCDGFNYENCYYSECGLTGGWYGNPEKTATKVTAEQLASGEVAYKLGTYFGQNIGVNQNPVRLTSGNKVHCVTVTGDTDYTIYVTNDTKAVWPGEMVDFILKNGEATFDKDSNITQDYNLTAVTVINGTCGDNLNWSFKGTSGVLTLTGTGAIDYYEDNTIPWGDFRSQVTTLILPEGLTKISYGAFRELPITSVIIPDSVTEVGDYAFYDCKNLSTVDLGDGCSIGEYAFYHCPVQTLELGASHSFDIGSFNSNALTSITIGADSASFDNGAFWNCSNLTEIHFTGSAPQYVKDKGIMTETSLASFRDVTWYYDCNQEGWLTSSRYNAQNQTWAKYKLVSEKHVEVVDDAVTPTCTETGLTEGSHCSVCETVIKEQEIVPSRHTYGSDHVCKYCEAIGGTCGSNLTWFLDNEGTLIISGSGAMYSYSYSKHAPWYEHRDLITSVILENGVTTISSYAFDYCQQLTRIEIPESVTSIGSDAFDQCTALVDVYITDISKWCTISFGNRYSQDYGNRYSNPMVYADNLYVDGVLATDIRLENGITQISDYAFYNCDTLTSVVIPDGVTSIGKYAFASCGNLKSVNIPDGVVRIEENTFAYCDNLTGVIIPDSVQYIEIQAFYGCGLNSISIPASVISIGKNAFYCKAKEIQVSSDNPNYSSADGVLLDKSQTKLIQMPYGFSGSFSIPDTVTEIAEYACYDCSDLTAIDIPPSVTQIGKWALHDCESLTEVMIPNGITSIEEGVFDSCENLLQIIIPETVTSIGDWAFYSTALTQVFIPDSITSIGTYAFSGCDKLASVFYGGNAEKHAAITIKGSNESLNNSTWYYNSSIQSICTHRTSTIPGVEATCTESGLTEGKHCNICGAILTAQKVIPAKGHNYSNWTVTTEPDCTKEGTESRTCSNCDQFETHNIAPTGHTEVIDTAIEPSCTETGLTEGSHCSVCNTTIVAQEVIPAGHVVENGVCTRCNVYGTCGENLIWEFNAETGMLTIFGTGEMNQYGSSDGVAWYEYKEQIETVVIESGATTIGTNAFRECINMTSVMIPDGVTTIDMAAFCKCTNLTSIIIPNTVTTIKSGAFEGCSSLTSVTIPASATTIGSFAFRGCTNLTGIWVDKSNSSYSSDNKGVLYNKNKTMLLVLPGALSGTYEILDSATTISWGAFYGCSRLTDVIIPASVSTIGDWAFQDNGISSVYFQGDAPTFGNKIFSGLTATVYYPIGNTTWTSNVMKNYGGNITWKPYGNPATKLILKSLDPKQMMGRRTNLSLYTVPSDATIDMIYSVSDSSILEILEFSDSTCSIMAYNPGTVTVTATDKLSGISTTLNLTLEAPHEISSIPFEDQIPINDSVVDRYYSFTPTKTGRYLFTATASSAPYLATSNIRVLNNKSWNLTYEYAGAEEGLFQVYADLEAGETYPVWVLYNGLSQDTKAVFKVDTLEYPSEVSGIRIKAADSIECEISPFVKPYYSSIYLETELLPGGSTGTISWEISDRNVLDFDDRSTGGSFVPKSCGTATVTAICNGHSDSVTITIKEPQSLYLNQWKAVTHDKGNSTHVFKFTPHKTGEYVITMDSNDNYYPQDILDIITEEDTYAQCPEFGYGIDTQKWYLNLEAGETYYLKMGVGNYYYSSNIPAYKLIIKESSGKPQAMHLRHLKQSIDNPEISFGTYFTPVNSHEEIVKVEVSDESILQLVPEWNWNTYHKCRFNVVGEGNVTVTATSESGLTASYTLYVGEAGNCDNGHDYDENHECIRCGAIGGTCGENLTWVFEEESGALTISGTGAMYDFDSECAPWYLYLADITSCVIEDGITSIGKFMLDYSEQDSINLKKIQIPISMQSIAYFAFWRIGDCPIEYAGTMRQWANLDDVQKPGAICSDGTIEACDSIGHLDEALDWIDTGRCYLTKEGVLYVDGDGESFGTSYIMETADRITSVVFLDGTTAFVDSGNSLQNADNIRSITFPASFKKLGSNISIKSLEEVHITDLGAWCQMERCQYLLGNGDKTGLQTGLYLNGELITKLVLPEEITSISDMAFAGYGKLESVSFHNQLQSIGSQAFASCTNLEEIRFEGTCPVIAENAFQSLSATAYYPAGNWQKSDLKDYGGEITWMAEGALVGDTDCNGVITDNDAVQLLWYTLFPDEYSLPDNGDVTGDSKVTVEDAIYVIWHTLFPEMYPIG